MKLELADVKHVYPTGDQALRGVNLTLEGTAPVAIVGQNGSGKTTMVKHFNGMLQPTEGNISIDGVDVSTKPTSDWAKTVGYVFQNPDDQVFLDSVRKEFSFGPRQIGMSNKEIQQRLVEVAELVGLSDQLDAHPFDLTATDKKFCTIGSIVMMKPKLVVFDEPTCGQDATGNRRLREVLAHLQNQGTLCVTISHDMKFVAANFERIIVMSEGKVLADGTRQEIFSQPELLKRTFVAPPPVTRVAQQAGISGCPFTVSELITDIYNERSHQQNG